MNTWHIVDARCEYPCWYFNTPLPCTSPWTMENGKIHTASQVPGLWWLSSWAAGDKRSIQHTPGRYEHYRRWWLSSGLRKVIVWSGGIWMMVITCKDLKVEWWRFLSSWLSVLLALAPVVLLIVADRAIIVTLMTGAPEEYWNMVLR